MHCIRWSSIIPPTIDRQSLGLTELKASPSQKPLTPRERRRSLGFLETNGASWACFLATFQATGSTWHGYIAFRPSHSELSSDEVRTTHIFLENSDCTLKPSRRTSPPRSVDSSRRFSTPIRPSWQGTGSTNISRFRRANLNDFARYMNRTGSIKYVTLYC